MKAFGGPLSYAMRPLSCDPAKLDGLSERLVVSHYENNYGGAVRAAKAGAYVDAFMRNIRWSDAAERHRGCVAT